MTDEWETVGWVLPNERVGTYLLDADHIYRIRTVGPDDQWTLHHIPIDSARVRGVLMRRKSHLPPVAPGVRESPCSTFWKGIIR